MLINLSPMFTSIPTENVRKPKEHWVKWIKILFFANRQDFI